MQDLESPCEYHYISVNNFTKSIEYFKINICDLDRSKFRIMEATMTKEQLEQEITALKDKLTGDMFQDMDIKDQIHNLEMKLNGVKPMDSHFDCVGCGS